MKRIRSRIATTHVDRHGDMLAYEALEGMVKQLNEMYLPMCFEHDMRYPTLGRVVSAELVELEDGHHAVETVSEMWEAGDGPENTLGDGRQIPLHTEDIGKIRIEFDRSYADNAGQAVVRSLEELSDPEDRAVRFEKKALEPISVLTIAAGAFVIGSLASGFSTRWVPMLGTRLKRS